MEPDFILDQVKSLRRALTTNMKQAQEKNVQIEDAFLHPETVIQQVEALEGVVTDSVKLHGRYGNVHKFAACNVEFSLNQGAHVQTAIGDSARVQSSVRDSGVKLPTTGSAFVLEVVKNLQDTVQDNAAVALAHTVDLNELSMSQPSFSVKVLGWFNHLLHSYAALLTEISVQREAHIKTESGFAKLMQENSQLSDEQKVAYNKLSDLELSLQKLEQENLHLRSEAVATEIVVQARIKKLMDELDSLRSAHSGCGRRLQERDSEVETLKEEHKKVIKSYEERLVSTAEDIRRLASHQLQSQHDKQSAALSEIEKSYEDFRISRAQEHDQMITENAWLHAELRKRSISSDAVDTRNMELKGKVDSLEKELHDVKEQLTATEIQSDNWKTTLDDVLSRQTAELDEFRRAAAQEREERQVADGLLVNAARKIEELEQKLKVKEDELSKWQQAQNKNHAVRLPPTPPTSTHKLSLSTSKKRKATNAEKASAWVQGENGWSVNLAAYGSPLSAQRASEVESLPDVAVDLGTPNATPVIFTRQSLSNILGGSIQGLVVRCTESATELARHNGIQDYLCPNMDHNAWSPAGPGKHGYMQVGLGRDRKLFNGEGDRRHVFVGTGKTFLYCGLYLAKRVEPLTKEEWETLPAKVKTTYSETTLNKEKSDKLKSGQHVLSMYNSGELRAPCVLLQCLEFDTAFYQDLVRANDQFFANKPRPAPAANNKRRKVEEVNGNRAEGAILTVSTTSQPCDTGSGFLSTLTPTPSTVLDPLDRTSIADTTAGAADVACRSEPPVPSSSAGVTAVISPSMTRMRTRFASRQRSPYGSLSLMLRIPGGKSPRDTSAQITEDEETVNEPSSESDDDDLYVDL